MQLKRLAIKQGIKPHTSFKSFERIFIEVFLLFFFLVTELELLEQRHNFSLAKGSMTLNQQLLLISQIVD